MEKYFAGEEFTEEETIAALKAGVKDGSIVPVICGAATTDIGISYLLNILTKYFPGPGEVGETSAETADGAAVKIPVSAAEPPAALVFKTVADPYVGKLSYFKVVSGK